MTNVFRAKKLLQKLIALGVKDYVICPGGRNAPFVKALGSYKGDAIKVHWGFEERSASFFALGLSLKNNDPVAIFTTSGTAFVETSSALLEAHYSGQPLIVISSDRPKRLWGTGAPQTMVQKDFLKSHLGPSVDESFDYSSVSYPLHINCVFDEPLIDEVSGDWTSALKVENFESKNALNLNTYKFEFANYEFEKIKNLIKYDKKKKVKVLCLLSGLNKSFKNSISNNISNIPVDFYFESTGEIQSHSSQLNSVFLKDTDVLETYDLIVRVGAIPIHRIWRDIETREFKKVIHFSRLPLPGLAHGEVFSLANFHLFLKDLMSLNLEKNFNNAMRNCGSISQEQKFYALLKEKCSTLSKKIDSANQESNPVFYLGNSTPVRFWDLDKTIKFDEVYASRGLNGIDGQLSTAIGLSLKSENQKTIAILGDLTTLYDLAAPWYWAKLYAKLNLTLIIVNNSGGQIFTEIFGDKNFLNSHNLKFVNWAKMWNLSYSKIHSIEELSKDFDSWPDVVELEIHGPY